MRTESNFGHDRKHSIVLWIWIICIFAGFLPALAPPADSQARVVAIGDVHGAYHEFASILQRSGLTDENRNWIGGSSVLVQTGDLLDRGRQSRDCLDLLMKIEIQARKQGGKVIPLLGNHEALNILGDLRFVTADIYRSFATSRSVKLRESAYRDYLRFLSAHGNHSHASVSRNDEAMRRKWEEEHPIGYFEYRDSFSPKGKYGAWLRAHDAIVTLRDGLFVHGGLNPLLQIRDVDEINSRIRSELTAFDSIWHSLADRRVIWRYMSLAEAVRHVAEELKWLTDNGEVENSQEVRQMQQLLAVSGWMISSEEGPLWYRGLAREPADQLAGPLKAMLTRLNARYVVAGHTVVSKSAITTRLDSRVFLIDVGMLKELYGGRASALEIQNGQFTALYADGECQVLAAPPPSAGGS